MKRFSVLPLLVLFAATVYAQERPAAPEGSGKETPSAGGSAGTVEEARMTALEDQLRTLAEQVALLRGELKEFRDANSVRPRQADQVPLASSHVEPGTLPTSAPVSAVPSTPEPAPNAPSPQFDQTQISGRATSNRTLLNPDLSLDG